MLNHYMLLSEYQSSSCKLPPLGPSSPPLKPSREPRSKPRRVIQMSTQAVSNDNANLAYIVFRKGRSSVPPPSESPALVHKITEKKRILPRFSKLTRSTKEIPHLF